MLFISGAILSIWEKLDPLRDLKYTHEFLKEFGAALISIVNTTLVAYLFAEIFKALIPPGFIESTGLLSIPLWLRIIGAYILKDFIYYITHRSFHANQYLWLSHKWHHSSQTIWWLAAQRTSFTSRVLYKISYIAFPLLAIPIEVMPIVALHAAVHDNWIHLNVKWRSWMKILEWFYVTPRVHTLHHYDMKGKNYGDVLTIFDRLFGTYADPETYDLKQNQSTLNQSALNNEPVTVKMIVGF
jgi:sterol desaturase/sphingolipid hydroxylase (fatty acid hydroxylase superfamily)